MEWESFWKNDQAVHSAQPYLITDALLENRVPSISMVLKHRVTWLSSVLKNSSHHNFLGCAAADGFFHYFNTQQILTWCGSLTRQESINQLLNFPNVKVYMPVYCGHRGTV